jgi:hypothetical protein
MLGTSQFTHVYIPVSDLKPPNIKIYRITILAVVSALRREERTSFEDDGKSGAEDNVDLTQRK